ncbi:hypothetical protein DFH06DRAFT_1302410 [Mycena polygramma]|nr:hypothetical protein DFH06DRAFT_1302410 [Mycena polygramma]
MWGHCDPWLSFTRTSIPETFQCLALFLRLPSIQRSVRVQVLPVQRREGNGLEISWCGEGPTFIRPLDHLRVTSNGHREYPSDILSVSGIVPIFNGPSYGSVAGVFSSVEPSSTATSDPATIGSYPITTRPVIIYGPGLSSLDSDSGTSTEISTTTSSISPTTSSSATTFSLTLFPPQFPTPHSSASSLSSVGSASFSAPNNDPSGFASATIPKTDPSGSAAASKESSAVEAPTVAPISLPSGASLTLGPSGIGKEPSNTISLSVFLPTDSAGRTTIGTISGTGASTAPAFVTSGSRTFSHNTGAIVGLAFGATIALVLGVLFALFACRRAKSAPMRKVAGLWISPPLLQDDGMDDAYSSVTRRRSRRPSPSFIRPASFPSLDMPPPTEQEIPTHGANFAPVPRPPVLVSPSSLSALFPEFYSGAASSKPSTPPSPSAAQPTPVNAKGFMRRLRRGLPSMASRGLLTTLAPVLERPTPATSVAEMSRPPSSLALASRQTQTFGEVLDDFPSVPEASPVQSPQNFSLPWIHRTRANQAAETPGWTPPATWAI